MEGKFIRDRRQRKAAHHPPIIVHLRAREIERRQRYRMRRAGVRTSASGRAIGILRSIVRVRKSSRVRATEVSKQVVIVRARWFGRLEGAVWVVPGS